MLGTRTELEINILNTLVLKVEVITKKILRVDVIGPFRPPQIFSI